MKIYVVRRAVAYVASCMLFAGISIVNTGCSNSLSPTSEKLNPVAEGNFSFDLQSISNTSKIQLVVMKPIGKRVWVTFKGPDGSPIDKFCTQKTGLGIYKNYNFSDAVEGVYSFEIGDNNKTITKTIKVSTDIPQAIRQLTISED